MKDGIYFGLPMAEYLRIQRFSSSSARDMTVSPATFWANSWLNPKNLPEEGEEEKETPAQIYGTADHSAKLEPDIFAQIYVRDVDLSAYKNLISTHTEIKAVFKDLGEPQTKAGEDVLAAARRLAAYGCDRPIKHLLEQEIRDGLEDFQIILPPSIFDQIVEDAAAIHANPEIAKLITGGQAEVTILWTDDKGVGWKARLDYLHSRHLVDLKTFDNSRGKLLEQALYDAVAYNRYFMQAYVQWVAAEQIRTGGLMIRKRQSQEQTDLIDAIRNSPDPFDYWWIWQEKFGVPNVLARRLRMTEEPHPHYLAEAPNEKTRAALKKKLTKPSLIWERARIQVEAARKQFLQGLEIWPDSPWGALVPVGEIDDEGFNRFWLEDY